MKLRTQILLLLFMFALAPLIVAMMVNRPLVLEQVELFYHQSHLQSLRADFRDLDQHLASRHEMVRLLAKLPEPGVVMGQSQQLATDAVNASRARYVRWVNRILEDQLDVIQLIFVDETGKERFWLERNQTDQRWRPTENFPGASSEHFVTATLKQEMGKVLVGAISIDPEAGTLDPHHYMTLRMASPLSGPRGENIGAVIVTVDVGGMARFYSNTLWVLNNGRFLQYGDQEAPQGSAFALYPGLEQIFSGAKSDLWKGQGEEIMWIPMFRTEQAGSLWVGRQVDQAPLSQLQDALSYRSAGIVMFIIVAMWLAARVVARRFDWVRQELSEGVQKVLSGDPVTFGWRRPEELRQLGEHLSQLAEEHGYNTRELQQRAEELEATSRYKSQFLANMSHELRTPLNSILLLSKMLSSAESGLSKEQLKQARVIHLAGADLKGLIENVLDLSRIEAGQSGLHLEEIDLKVLLNDLYDLLHPQFVDKGLHLELQLEPDAPRVIRSDPDKLRQIIKNFLSNAVKFAGQGTVMLILTATKKEPYKLAIQVSDEGIGIAPDKQQQIFQAFRQGESSTNRRYGGTGLGLSISQQLAHLLGGYIMVESAEGEGATFSLFLPEILDEAELEPARTALMAAEEPEVGEISNAGIEADFSGHHILIVNLDVPNLLSLMPVLERWKIGVTAADGGVEAMEVLEDDESLSWLLVNVPDPPGDCYATIKAIRAMERFKSLPVIAMTEDERLRSSKNCQDVGITECLAKPIVHQELKEVLARHLKS